MKDNIITIDGPSASGKGSLARNIAAHLNFDILDSGLLYRVYAYLFDCWPRTYKNSCTYQERYII